jgi:murein DD-endopeptidase MepM/ murein hydrolase activator NlpD
MYYAGTVFCKRKSCLVFQATKVSQPSRNLTKRQRQCGFATPDFFTLVINARSTMKKLLFVFLFILVIIIVYFSSGSDVTNNLDTYVYDLPFKEGTKHKVVQGYGGRFSHSHKAALDFAMPEGTPVFAAREGTIYSYKDDSNEGGPFTNERKANYIIIRHSDGGFGCYWHLKQNGVVVKNGLVAKGQLIGYSGRTGFVLWPHLHFAVKRKLNYKKDSFVRTKFITSNGTVLLKAGNSYEKSLR